MQGVPVDKQLNATKAMQASGEEVWWGGPGWRGQGCVPYAVLHPAFPRHACGHAYDTRCHSLSLLADATPVMRLSLLQALRALHDRGVAHGDLRGGNLLVDKDGKVRNLSVESQGQAGLRRCFETGVMARSMTMRDCELTLDRGRTESSPECRDRLQTVRAACRWTAARVRRVAASHLQVWLLDLGHSYRNPSQRQKDEEMAQLHALFQGSSGGSAQTISRRRRQ